MPKVSTKKKQTQDADLGSIFDHFEAQNPGGGTGGEPKKTPEVDLTALQAQITALSSRLEQSEATNRALLTQAPRTEPVQQTTAPAGIDLKGLPDPIEESEKYGIMLAERIAAHTKAVTEAAQNSMRSEQSQEKQIEELWEGFGKKYSDLAEDQDRVEFAATKVAKEAKAKGMDVSKYMFVTRDQFYADVAKKHEELFGKPSDGDDNDTPEEPDRTAGIFGGMESGGRPATGKQPPQGDMIKDLQDLQRKGGYF